MKTIGFTICFLVSIHCGLVRGQSVDQIKQTMLKATKYMVEEVSTNGGYVGIYYEDLSRRWGELEAFETQIWVQEPGTVSMGNLFLDAYYITKDEYYYEAAEKVAEALIWGQLPVGGWNYMIDFAGDRSLKEWYNTIGKNAWGFEEHNQYYGNATFDDVTTSKAAEFLLRVYLEKLDTRYKPALDKAIDFVLSAQYPLGGWPQRYPLMHNHPHNGKEDYTSFYTYNDDVIWGNLEFLIDCYYTLGEERLLDPIHRAMNFFLITQQGNPQGGWAEQYDMNLRPAHARTYEPAGLMPGATFRIAMRMLDFYKYTGDRRYLSRIPDAIEWLKAARLPENQTENGTRTHPTFVEVGTNKGLYAHRTGTGIHDGRYWVDYNDKNLLAHYGGKANVNIQLLINEYDKVNAMTPSEATVGSPLKIERFGRNATPQEYFLKRKVSEMIIFPNSNLNDVISSLDEKGRWLTKNEWISRPYSVSADGVETNTARNSDEAGRAIRDPSNQNYITIREYIKNMSILMNKIKGDIL